MFLHALAFAMLPCHLGALCYRRFYVLLPTRVGKPKRIMRRPLAPNKRGKRRGLGPMRANGFHKMLLVNVDDGFAWIAYGILIGEIRVQVFCWQKAWTLRGKDPPGGGTGGLDPK